MDDIKKSELIFEYLEESKDVFLQLQTMIEKLIDIYLSTKADVYYNEIIGWINKNANHKIFLACVDVSRYRQIFDIISLEKKRNHIVFSHNVDNHKQLIEKYVKTLLMLRRIELGLEQPFYNEAINYIKDNKISMIAIDKIFEDELFADVEKIKQSLGAEELWS